MSDPVIFEASDKQEAAFPTMDQSPCLVCEVEIVLVIDATTGIINYPAQALTVDPMREDSFGDNALYRHSINTRMRSFPTQQGGQCYSPSPEVR
jgi:hypothetical protein